MNISLQKARMNLSFDHIHLYVDSVSSLESYKTLESLHNQFCDGDLTRSRWEELCKNHGRTALVPDDYTPHAQDVIEQLIVGMGFRTTGIGARGDILIASPDSGGVRIVVSPKVSTASSGEIDHLSEANISQFYSSHNGRQGIAVLAFKCLPGAVDEILSAYKSKQAALVKTPNVHQYAAGEWKFAEVYAYYDSSGLKEADKGTVLRFIEGPEDSLLPGFEPLPAVFPNITGNRAYFDHWVSNVVNRNEFLDTLKSTLGFTPKVDFNAGVVAAGEAMIESTVTGNSSSTVITNLAEGLVDQSQIYLPINNALSPVGHVHLFLEEIGQGVQHIASRVSDLVGFVTNINHMREITGEGFSFLRIPASYYGRLDRTDLVGCGLSEEVALKCISALSDRGLVSTSGVVKLELEESDLQCLNAVISGKSLLSAIAVVKKARYSNLYKLLKDNLCEETYLGIVRNKILVDIQGEDILYQIFTSNILQRNPGEEAPFFEYIQRVCSEQLDLDGNPKKLRPGCGGFGIRNFLTLFLSIEVSKAMFELDSADAAGDLAAAQVSERKIAIFTAQLDDSNPVLTCISDAMTAEAIALEHLDACEDDESRRVYEAEILSQQKIKEGAQTELMAISKKYAGMMQVIRLGEEAD